MDIHEVATGVHLVGASNTNFVVLADGGRVTLVDSGYPRDRELLQAAVAQTGHTPADVSATVLTHAHVDHLGSAVWLRRDHGVPVHCHAEEAAHARGEVEESIAERELLGRIWRPGVLRFTLNAVVSGALRAERPEAVSTFTDGEILDLPGHPEVVHTPGHTSGHVALHLPDRGVLLAGDALITVDVWDRSRRGPQLIRAPFNHDHDRARASLERLEDLDAEVVVPGHGRVWRASPAEAVAQARRSAP